MTARVARCVAVCLLSVAATVAALGGVATAASTPGVAWKISLVAEPANLSGAGSQYLLVLTNTGSVVSSGPIVLTDTLPANVTDGGPLHFSTEGWECSASIGGTIMTCTYGGVVPALGQTTVLAIPVAVGTAGTLTNQVEVSGGGAPVATANLSTEMASSLPFGFLDFSNQTSDVSGGPDTQAGSHPYALTTTFAFPQGVRNPKDMEIDLPAGLVGDPQAATRCTIVAVFAHACPASSQVGTILVNMAQTLFRGYSAFPIYNVVPERGYPAEFGLFAEGVNRPVFLYASVGAGPAYDLHISVPDIPAVAHASSAVVVFFGDPEGMSNPPGDKVNSSVPFFTSPSDCSDVPLITTIEADSWEEPESWVHDAAQAQPVAGCNLLRFQPSIAVTPESAVADEPTGYEVDVQVPQSQSVGLEGLATPPVKETTVKLPAGVSISPAAADGLVACPAEGPEGIDLAQAGPGHCPQASQVGTLEALTPLLAEPLHGQVYVAQPGCGGAGQAPCGEGDALDGNLFGLYLQIEGSGVTVKLRGTVSANPATGRLTATFSDLPQLPFSDLKLTLKGTPRAPLANPQACGEAVTTSDFTPWSSPETPDANPSSAFAVTGCEGSPFAPTFQAESTSAAAGAYTSFSATFGRADRMQDLSGIQVQTPPGLAGMISHVALCGEPQAASGTCPAASRVGTATAGAGAGSHPFWVSGPVYLTGPYRGAPFGLVVAIPATAGPFNLGTVVVRSTLSIDPTTAAVTVTSDPLPQIIDGVPLRVQTVNVTLDRPQFLFNPTNCVARQVTAKIASAQGAVAQVASPFAAGGCRNLPFDPGFKVSTRAPGSKKRGVSFDVKVSSRAGDANIHSVAVSLPKQLPARLTTIQKACRDTVFDANPAACPPGSLVGIVLANSPVLPVTLSGPAYLVSHGGAAFPDLDVIVQGEGVRVDLTGSINISRSGITSSAFASVPDVPISSFELRLPEGPYSALTTAGSLCAKPLTMPTTIVGQNGRRLVRTTKIAVAGCAKTPGKKVHKARHGGKA